MVKDMKAVLILIFAVLAIICFLGMVVEKEDVKLKKMMTYGFFVLVFCVTLLALKPHKIGFYILTIFSVLMYLNLLAIIFESFRSRKQLKILTQYTEAIKDHDEKLTEANKILNERNNILIEKNNMLVDVLMKIKEPQKEGE